MRRIGHWNKNPKGIFYDGSHTLKTYWDEENNCFRCGSCDRAVKDGVVCDCARKNK